MLPKKPYFSETRLDSLKHVLIFYPSFSYNIARRTKCNSNQCNGTTPTHSSLQVNQFHNNGIEESKEKIRKFQDGEQVRFFQNTTTTTTTQQLEENNHNSSLYPHVLVFEQRNKFGISIKRTFFFCKRIENSTIQLLKCVDSMI